MCRLGRCEWRSPFEMINFLSFQSDDKVGMKNFITVGLKKGECQDKSHNTTMMHSEAGEAYKMNAHRVPLACQIH